MADMGLAGMAGAAGAGDAIQTIFQQRMAAAESARRDQQQQIQQQEFQQNQARLDALMRVTADEKAASAREAMKRDADQATARQETRDTATFTNTPVGADVPAGPAQRMQTMGLPLSKVPGQQVQQTAGFMPLPSAPSQGPGMQAMGGLTPVQGPQIGAGQSTTSADAASPLNAPDRFTRGATQADVEKQRTLEEREAALKQAGENQDWRNSIAQQLADLKDSQAPPSSFQLQPEIDPKTGQQTGRFLGYNTKMNRWEPVQGQGPEATKAAPGAAQLAIKDHDKNEALTVLSKLDSAIDDAKDLVGPGAGRVSSIEQMIGSPDPKIQRLGVFMKGAKMKIDAGIGGARAAASPYMMKQWDNLLGNNITPDGLKSAVQAMRELLGGDAAQGGGGGGLPTVGGTFNGGKVLKVEKVQ